MRLDTTLTQRMDQRMILAPRMIQSMEILQLPIMALQERIQQELQENPVLELKEASTDERNTEEDTDVPSTADPEVAPAPAEPEPSADSTDEFERLDALSRDWEDQFNDD